MYSIAGILELVKGLKFREKKAAAFGCYGWHDASTAIIEYLLTESGFEIISEPLSSLWEPDRNFLEKSMEYGEKFVAALS